MIETRKKSESKNVSASFLSFFSVQCVIVLTIVPICSLEKFDDDSFIHSIGFNSIPNIHAYKIKFENQNN